MTSITKTYSAGERTVVVPFGVYSIDFDLDGAGGGAGGRDADSHAGGDGGAGAKVTGTVAVEPGQTIKLYVGTGGIVGATHSGNGGGGGGGAWSALYLDDELVAIAGGGGGGGGGLQNATDNNAHGGNGGGSPSLTWSGQSGTAALGSGGGAGGNGGVGGTATGSADSGTQYNGGNGGPTADALGGSGYYPGGTRGNGGRGGTEGAGSTIAGGGGGGGGWGGGAGGGLSYWGGGGGGGSYANPSLVTNAAAVRGGGSAGGDADLATPESGAPGIATLTWDVQTPTNVWLEPQITEEFADGETATLTWDTAELFESLFGDVGYPSEAIVLYEADVIVFDGDDVHMSIATLTQRISQSDYQRHTISMVRNVVGFEINEEDEEGNYIVARFQGSQPSNNMVLTITPRLGATSMQVAVSPRLIGFLSS